MRTRQEIKEQVYSREDGLIIKNGEIYTTKISKEDAILELLFDIRDLLTK